MAGECIGNRIAKTVISVAAIIIGVNMAARSWAYFLLVAYGGFLLTSMYNTANRTARRTIEAVKASKLGFPRSRYDFEQDSLRVFSLPGGEELDGLKYSAVRALSEDHRYFYLFRDENSGYIVPRAALGDKAGDFRTFIESRSGKTFFTRRSPLAKVKAYIRKRENEPYHL